MRQESRPDDQIWCFCLCFCLLPCSPLVGQSVTACFICSDISGLVLSHDAQWKKKWAISIYWNTDAGWRMLESPPFYSMVKVRVLSVNSFCVTVCLLLQLFGSVTADVTLTAAERVINHRLASVQSSLMQPLAREWIIAPCLSCFSWETA